tara:strand:- start:6813 stop:7337 length:525 start_codon:yes stop_codon:yes gene_type:complete
MLKLIIRIIPLSLIGFIIVVFFIGLNKSAIYDTKDLVGKKLEKIKLDHLSDNIVITDKDLQKNNYTLINFWASWCVPCLDEHPFLVQLSKEKNLKILGVNYKDNKNNALKFLDRYGNPYHYNAKDFYGKQSIVFGIYGIPESILLDKELTIIKKFVGPINKKDLNFIKMTLGNL